jgi:hypothetical protein
VDELDASQIADDGGDDLWPLALSASLGGEQQQWRLEREGS